jgi:hypothetical protein
MVKIGRPKRKELDDIDQAVAERMYVEQSMSMQRIADALDASYWEVRACLIKNGVAIRPKGRVKE